MQYIFIFISTLFFLGCSPKYKTVSEYIVPSSEAGKACLAECQKQYGSCKEICNANFDICKVKAYEVAQQNFDRKMQYYIAQLEQYATQMQMYELERELYYFDGFYGHGFRYPGYYYPHRMFFGYSFSMIRPLKPIRPTLEHEIRLAEQQMCKIDCGCTKTYNECYVRCGGVIKKTEVCTKNCPDEK